MMKCYTSTCNQSKLFKNNFFKILTLKTEIIAISEFLKIKSFLKDVYSECCLSN